VCYHSADDQSRKAIDHRADVVSEQFEPSKIPLAIAGKDDPSDPSTEAQVIDAISYRNCLSSADGP